MLDHAYQAPWLYPQKLEDATRKTGVIMVGISRRRDLSKGTDVTKKLDEDVRHFFVF